MTSPASVTPNSVTPSSVTPASVTPARVLRGYQQWLPDLQLGLQNLLLHRLRSLLTMLGMIFGVAAVVSMLSIGAGARQKVMALIEQMGVHNLIVEAKETLDWGAYRKLRKISPGLTFEDYRVIRDDVGGDIVAATPRKRLTPTKTIPKSQQDPPTVYGVNPSYLKIAGLHVLEGRFFTDDEETRASPVCVLGAAARSSLFGGTDPMGQYIKANEQWFRVIGVASPQLSSQTEVAGVPTQDLNNTLYVPLNSAILRLEDSYSNRRDEIDGMYLNIRDGADMSSVAQLVRAILDSSHHSAGDFSVIVPAELLAEQRRTERLFNAVMVAIASISLLVGGIGIMNIMLASILERTREIGVRRAVGARQSDIIRQFVVEAMLISFVGGSFGIVFGFVMSRLIAWLAGWSTIVTFSSILLAFVVSISVGLVFGIYPAVKAARLDPVEAIRYE
ncbi:MAG: ABC transporter permease [Candidatus Sulfotelmatobacter sp.]